MKNKNFFYAAFQNRGSAYIVYIERGDSYD